MNLQEVALADKARKRGRTSHLTPLLTVQLYIMLTFMYVCVHNLFVFTYRRDGRRRDISDTIHMYK